MGVSLLVFLVIGSAVLWLTPSVSGAWGATGAGHLVIIGGGLDPDHEAVYRAFLDRCPRGARIGVLPTASGSPQRSGVLTVGDIERYLTDRERAAGTRVELIHITRHDAEAAMSEHLGDYLRGFDAFWFTGGDQSRIMDVFRPLASRDQQPLEPTESNGHKLRVIDTPAYLAIKEVLGRGGVIAGTSAGAAMMSDPMIRWGNSAEALLIGRSDITEDWGVGVGRGMGFFPLGLIDQHAIERGRAGRLLTAMLTTRTPVGLAIGEDTAAVVDLSTGGLEVVGRSSVLAMRLIEPDVVAVRSPPPVGFTIEAELFSNGDGLTLHGEGWRGRDRAMAEPARREDPPMQRAFAGLPRQADYEFPFDLVAQGSTDEGAASWRVSPRAAAVELADDVRRRWLEAGRRDRLEAAEAEGLEHP